MDKAQMLSIRESTIALKNLLVEGENKDRTDVDTLTSNTMVIVSGVVLRGVVLCYVMWCGVVCQFRCLILSCPVLSYHIYLSTISLHSSPVCVSSSHFSSFHSFLHYSILQLLDCRNIANLFKGVPRTKGLYPALLLVLNSIRNGTRCLMPPPHL